MDLDEILMVEFLYVYNTYIIYIMELETVQGTDIDLERCRSRKKQI